MTRIERFRPDPIPAIHPLPEYLATGQRAEWYEDTKQVLQVPWMGVVTMAYTHYPAFFGELSEFSNTELCDGDKLTPGNVIEGPSMLEYEGTTIVVRPKQAAVVDEFKNIVVTL